MLEACSKNFTGQVFGSSLKTSILVADSYDASKISHTDKQMKVSTYYLLLYLLLSQVEYNNYC